MLHFCLKSRLPDDVHNRGADKNGTGLRPFSFHQSFDFIRHFGAGRSAPMPLKRKGNRGQGK